MITLKEQIIQEIRYAPEESTLKTIETLDTGEYNEMTFYCPQSELVQIFNNFFTDDLKGHVPGGKPTQIKGWEVIEK